jgi:hypothetical protein
MPHYTFKRGDRTKIFKAKVEQYDRLLKLLTFWGWERVIDLPASVHVRGTMSEYMNESITEADRVDREEGWTGVADV